MRAGIIGAGRVGCSLAIALLKKGMPITGVYSRDVVSARILMKELVCPVFDDISSLVESSDTVFITVPDTSISSVSEQIVKSCGRNSLKGKMFLHCSGALTSDELRCICEEGGFTGSLHPIQTFPNRLDSWESMYNISFGFEGSIEAEAAATEVVSLLGGEMFRVSAEGKSLYHAAACVLSNYTVTLSYVAAKLLEHAGINGEIGIRAFAPLLHSTVENITRLGIVEALTGPVSRGDTGTVAVHLKAMGQAFPNETDLYMSLGRETVELALEKGTIDEDQAGEMMKLLS